MICELDANLSTDPDQHTSSDHTGLDESGIAEACPSGARYKPHASDAQRQSFGDVLDAICFDIDDTLFDHERMSRAGLTALVGNDAAWPVWDELSRRQFQRVLDGAIDYDTMCLERIQAFFAAFGEDVSVEESRQREQRRVSAQKAAHRLFDDVQPCLDWLRSTHYRIGVITNAPLDIQWEKMDALGIAHHFDAFIASGECGSVKPEQHIFDRASEELEIPHSRILHIGDRLDLDAEGAVHAGMHGVWLNRFQAKPETIPAGVHVLPNLEELPDLLNRRSESVRQGAGQVSGTVGPGSEWARAMV